MTYSPNEVYSQISVSTEVMHASPHRLIQMLFEKCMQQLQQAKAVMESPQGNKKKKVSCLSRAKDIVDYLRSCLISPDEQTLKVSQALDAAYAQVGKCIVLTTLHNDSGYLDQALQSMTSLKSAWDTIQ